MKTAIIILNYNSLSDTIKYVNSIGNYSVLDTIVVVDNCSTEKSSLEELKKLKNEKIHIIQTPKNGGYSYGNNYGLKYLSSLNEKFDYVIISNSDIEVKEDTIKKCLKELEENEGVAVVAPKMLDKNGNKIRRSSWKIRTPGIDMANSTRLTEFLLHPLFRRGEYSKKDFESPKLQVEAVSGAFFVIKFDVFKKAGFFDENVFLFYEEDILAIKIRDLGYSEYSLNDISYTHYESQTIDKSLNYYNKIKRLQKSKMYYQKKYNKINVFQSAIFHILNFWRKIELIIEIPIRKILGK